MAGIPHRRTDALDLRKASLSRKQGAVARPLTFQGKGHEQWVLFVLDPSGNAIEITSFYPSRPPGT